MQRFLILMQSSVLECYFLATILHKQGRVQQMLQYSNFDDEKRRR